MEPHLQGEYRGSEAKEGMGFLNCWPQDGAWREAGAVGASASSLSEAKTLGT